MNDPIVLRTEDQPDPQEHGIALLDVLREIERSAAELRRLVTTWHADPARSQRRATDEAVELVVAAGRARDAAEAMLRARRLAGELSHAYRGVQHVR